MSAPYDDGPGPWDEEPPYDDAADWLPDDEPQPKDLDIGKSWAPVDLGPILSGDYKPVEPTILCRSDGQALLYRGRTHAFVGETESAKTWLALLAVAQVLCSGGHAAFIDFEDDEEGIVERLLALSVKADVIGGPRFAYVRPDEQVTAGELHLAELLARPLDLVIVDGMTEALSLHGLKSNSDVDVAHLQRILMKRIATTGNRPAVAGIDHVTKDPETRGKHATGSQHKTAGITGAQYIVEAKQTWAPGKGGRSKITVAKDRKGRVRAACVNGSHVGELVGTSWPDERLDLDVIVAAPERKASDGGWRPTGLMEKVSSFFARDPTGDHSKSAVRRGVTGDDKTIDRALEVLVLEGYVDRKPHGQTHYHRHLKTYEQTLDGSDPDNQAA